MQACLGLSGVALRPVCWGWLDTPSRPTSNPNPHPHPSPNPNITLTLSITTKVAKANRLNAEQSEVSKTALEKAYFQPWP